MAPQSRKNKAQPEPATGESGNAEAQNGRPVEAFASGFGITVLFVIL